MVTHSSGNHAQAVALAASLRGIRATIVMPVTAPAVKRAAVEGYGATVVECAPTLDARVRTTEEVIARTGATLIHAYDHPHVIAGQGTAALELHDEVPDLDAVVAPVGGGGLVSGTALATRGLSPRCAVIGAEPAGADDAARSVATGTHVTHHEPRTVADGLLTTLGDHTWPVIRDLVDRIVVVDDDAILAAMRLLYERMKLVVEPSAAVALAAVLSPDFPPGPRRVGVILSGGNLDFDPLFAALRRSP